MILTAVAALFLVGPAAAAPADPLDAKAREWEAKGFKVKDRISRASEGLLLAAVVYAKEDGSGDRLETYVVSPKKAYLGYSHPAETELLELDGTPAGRGFRDLLGDGSRIIAYHATIRALNATSLVILRYKQFKFERLQDFPEGRFLSSEKEDLVESRDLPLGRFLAVGCEDFGTISQTAFRTRLYAVRDGKFVDVSRSHRERYAAEIARKTAALERLKPDLQKRAGEYLGLALSIYYDYSARGEARKGWDLQKKFFTVPGYAPPSVHTCFDAMRKDLRARLNVPADWP